MKDRIIKLLIEHGYKPVDITAMLFDDSPGNWAVEFSYKDEKGTMLSESVSPETLVKDLWWLI